MRSFSADFEGTERFQVKDHLGSGTSGEVYCVYDRKLHSYVALKTLQRADPAAIFRFKTEFRALADVSHPNLAQLYELLMDGDRWFFTMELIDGYDFMEYSRGEPQSLEQEPEASPPADYARLRDAMAQLATGLSALHRSGKLHCDIKPTNIRVDQKGRIVLLDFGLVQELFPGAGDLTIDADLTGTPAYMSPEQASGQRLNEATDWYSVGVVLYEALTGRRPFYGGFLQVLQKKQLEDPVPPSQLVPGTPEDLDKLCQRLMIRDPTKRHTGDKVLRALGEVRDLTLESHRSSISGVGTPLIGREWHLATLNEAFERTRRGQAMVTYVHGSSGMGKSALVEQFLDQIRDEHGDTVVLKGRCYERESVPYKALDSLIDALSHYLTRLDSNEAEVLMPANVQALARLFPALKRIQMVARAQRRVLEIPDEREQKRRARTALRELIQRLANRHPLILYIDDLQWGDHDSAELLSELLRPPEPPPLLLICSYRSEEKESSPLLQALLTSQHIQEGTEVREIAVEELSEVDAQALATLLLGPRGGPATAPVARVIARESAGSPYFVAELVRYAMLKSRGSASGVNLEIDSAGMTLGRLILARLAQLTPEATRLLELVAVAGQPLDLEVALQAAELGAASQGAVTQLRAGSLIRIRRSRNFDEIETYHTRIREAVARTMVGKSLVRYHTSLALALEASERSDPETLATHFREAGDHERQARYTVAAAEAAYEALAFSHAARLYRSALELSAYSPVPRRELLIKLGDSLTNSGRGAEAAPPYLEAVKGAATAEEAVELRRRAAEQQLLSGHITEGLETFQQVLKSIGMSMPSSPAKALLSIGAHRARLALRGIKFKEQDASTISREQLLKLDACRSVATGLSNVDPLRGMDFATRYFLLSLDAGEPLRVALSFAIEAGFSSTGGTRTRNRTNKLLETSRTLAERVNNPEAIGLSMMTDGAASYFSCQGPRALEIWEKAEEILRENCTGVTWQLDTLMHWKYRLMIFLGQLRKVHNELPAVVKDFMERGDIYAESTMRSVVNWFMRLVVDQPDLAEDEIQRARDSWSQEDYHLQHYLQLIGHVEISLYRGDGLSAWAGMVEQWSPLVRSQLLRVLELTRAEAFHLRCRAALGAVISLGAQSPQTAPILKTLRKVLRQLDKQTSPWAKPWAHLVHAGLLSFEGDKDEAVNRLVSAAAGFDSFHMGLYAAVARRRRGQLVGGDDGLRFINDAEAWMAKEGVVNPARMSDALAPGVWD